MPWSKKKIITLLFVVSVCDIIKCIKLPNIYKNNKYWYVGHLLPFSSLKWIDKILY